MSASTDQSNVDMEMLNQLFDDCDTIVTGQVKTNDVISRLQELFKTEFVNEREQKKQLNDLTRRLDPRKDNWYANHLISSKFVSVMLLDLFISTPFY